MIDLGEFSRRAFKYLLEGLMVGIAAYAIPKAGCQGGKQNNCDASKN